MKSIPFSPPDISDLEVYEVEKALRSGWITTGPRTKKLEELVAEFCKINNAVCLNSATASLETTLRILGVGIGDEVITSAYTYTASASVIEHVGAKIVLIDTAPDSFEMDYEKMAEAITERTKVIIPVDFAGVMCDYEKIFQIVEKKKNFFIPRNEIQKKIGRIIVAADAAHAFGASYHGKMAGEVADFTTFSFHAVKNFTTGEGGAAVWKDIAGIDSKDIYKLYQLYSLHGQSKDALAKTKLGAWEYDIKTLGYKCNMTDIMAAIGLAQMQRYEKLLKRRAEIIRIYDDAFQDVPVTCLKHTSNSAKGSGHLYVVRLDGKDVNYRNELIRKMAEKGIATNVHYKPLPMHTAYKKLGFNISNYPNAYNMYQNEITLPLHTKLSSSDISYIINTFKEIIGN